MKRKKIYYAHSMKLYGTPEESRQIEYIEQQFMKYRLLNPADFPDLAPFSNYLTIVSNCDLVICSEYQGFVGRGVYEEVMRALILEKRVYVIRKIKNTYRRYIVSDIDLVDKNNQIHFGQLLVQ